MQRCPLDYKRVLRDVSDRGLIALPRRLGIAIKHDYRSVVLVSSGARISRPRSKAAAVAAGMDQVVKVDQLKSMLDRDLEATSVTALRRYVSSDTVQRIGRELAALHRSAHAIDRAARFGFTESTPPPPAAVPVAATRPARSGRGPDSGRVCASCGAPVSTGVARFSEQHPDRFGGRILCMTCQNDASA